MPADPNMIFIDSSVNDVVQERHLSRPFVIIKKKSEVIKTKMAIDKNLKE